MSNRAKDTTITIEDDIDTLLREHVRDDNCTPDEWCTLCGDLWPCRVAYVATALKWIRGFQLDPWDVEVRR